MLIWSQQAVITLVRYITNCYISHLFSYLIFCCFLLLCIATYIWNFNNLLHLLYEQIRVEGNTNSRIHNYHDLDMCFSCIFSQNSYVCMCEYMNNRGWCDKYFGGLVCGDNVRVISSSFTDNLTVSSFCCGEVVGSSGWIR